MHRLMKEEVEIRGLELNQKWCDVIGRIQAAKAADASLALKGVSHSTA
jgi:hypothetical protein